MFTDMVGYTALGQMNESLSLALADEQKSLIRPILGRHHGREVKTMGDAFLAEFPSSLDAIRCAYDIQRATREYNISRQPEHRIHLRVGVHLGDVVEDQGDISGDAVNIASRVEPLAEDGGVCLTRQIYDQVQNKLDLPFESMGPKQLKNVTAPMEVFRMVMPWDRDAPSKPMQFDKKRVAVLPFTNMSPDPVDDYFADGMTEELITSLSGINGLSVIARTSVMRYKASPKGISDVAKELSVGTLVEGSVRKAGDRLRITVQLIDARTESHAWAKNYDKKMDDVFAIQSDVAKQVADALEVQLLSADRKRLEKAPTNNIEAYTEYLKGMYHFNRDWGETEPLKTALAHFEKAIANDPKFALAYAMLAFTYNQMGFFGRIPSAEAGARSKELAEKALILDDQSAEAHQIMGRVHRNYTWDFQAAQKEFDRAIELSPSYVEAIGNSALLKQFNRQNDESVEEARTVLDLDPATGRGSGYGGTIFLYTGHYAEAIEQFKKYLEVDPKSTYTIGNLGLAHIQIGELELGLSELETATVHGSSSRSDLVYGYAKAGKMEKVREQLQELLVLVEQDRELIMAVAVAYANLGDSDKAMEWLEKAYKEHIGYLVSANSDFAFDAIRRDPRFQALMKKIGWTNTE